MSSGHDPGGGGPEVIITADMLPQDVGSMVPAMPTSNNGEHIMGLPLREAREVFERDYLIAQISRFSGNISRTAEFVGMERSALHRKLKALASLNADPAFESEDAALCRALLSEVRFHEPRCARFIPCIDWQFGFFPCFYGRLRASTAWATCELACLTTTPAF